MHSLLDYATMGKLEMPMKNFIVTTCQNSLLLVSNLMGLNVLGHESLLFVRYSFYIINALHVYSYFKTIIRILDHRG